MIHPESLCARVRQQLVEVGAGTVPSGAVAAHLADCVACRAFADRLTAARGALRARAAAVEPGPDFAVRVVAALPGSSDLLGWAALRLLPAALALLLGLTLFAMTQTPPATALLDDPSSDLLLAYTALAPEAPASPSPGVIE